MFYREIYVQELTQILLKEMVKEVLIWWVMASIVSEGLLWDEFLTDHILDIFKTSLQLKDGVWIIVFVLEYRKQRSI